MSHEPQQLFPGGGEVLGSAALLQQDSWGPPSSLPGPPPTGGWQPDLAVQHQQALAQLRMPSPPLLPPMSQPGHQPAGLHPVPVLSPTLGPALPPVSPYQQVRSGPAHMEVLLSILEGFF